MLSVVGFGGTHRERDQLNRWSRRRSRMFARISTTMGEGGNVRLVTSLPRMITMFKLSLVRLDLYLSSRVQPELFVIDGGSRIASGWRPMCVGVDQPGGYKPSTQHQHNTIDDAYLCAILELLTLSHIRKQPFHLRRSTFTSNIRRRQDSYCAIVFTSQVKTEQLAIDLTTQ
jgi:hypothetical protein